MVALPPTSWFYHCTVSSRAILLLLSLNLLLSSQQSTAFGVYEGPLILYLSRKTRYSAFSVVTKNYGAFRCTRCGVHDNQNVRLTVEIDILVSGRRSVRDAAEKRGFGAVQTRPNTRFKSRPMLHSPSPHSKDKCTALQRLWWGRVYSVCAWT